MTQVVTLYDTTLRDGSQSEDIAFSVEDKLRIARRLDEFGIHYIEGGWPGSNPKDVAFFERAKRERLVRAKFTAFGSTRRKGIACAQDANIQALVEAETPAVAVVGKSWDLHAREALKVGLEENLDIIGQSLSYLKERVGEVIFDAEHFFDGYARNPEYAMQVLRAAEEAGVDLICLCDTNGGTLPADVERIFSTVTAEVKTPLGIHAHNDSELAVANSLAAVRAGAAQVQGTINGFGERTGNANLCSIIPNLVLKMDRPVVPREKLAHLTGLSRFVDAIANRHPDKRQPFVGESSFAHKGGIHVSAVQRNPVTYEHIDPAAIGNTRRVLISDLSGRANIVAKAAELGIHLETSDPITGQVLEEIKEKENRGYVFEGAEASFELLIRRALGASKRYFTLKGYRVISDVRGDGDRPVIEATILLEVGGQREHTAAEGNGPVNALDQALRKALERFYPQLAEMELIDYKVRILDTQSGTAAVTQVLIESGDGADAWGTVGVSENIIEASWEALIDSIVYKLAKDERTGVRPS